MPCLKPRRAFRVKSGPDKNGKWKITFNMSEGLTDDDSIILVPCGQCLGCMEKRAKQWAIRCVHESIMCEDSCFITLTYDNKNYIEKCQWGNLNKGEFERFMKRLRSRLSPLKIRFYQCGEYGSKTKRPHHHMALFNYAFPDRELWSDKNGVKLYVSKMLNEVWGNGYCVIGDLNNASAEYIAKYIVKDVSKCWKPSYAEVEPYSTMSRRPGLGLTFMKDYGTDLYVNDVVIGDGAPIGKPPRYYDNVLKMIRPEIYNIIKENRKEVAKVNGLSARQLRIREELMRISRKRKEREPE